MFKELIAVMVASLLTVSTVQAASPLLLPVTLSDQARAWTTESVEFGA